MILRSTILPVTAGLLLLCPSAFATVRPHHHSSAHAIVRRSATSHSAHAAHITEHAAVGMSSERATEIQSALIQRGYLTGEPTGSWDSASVAAMQKMQSDNGWQTKLVPDSRALIKLGLGPTSSPAAAPSTASAAVAAPISPQSF